MTNINELPREILHIILGYLQIYDMKFLISPRYSPELWTCPGNPFKKVYDHLYNLIVSDNADTSIFNAMNVCRLWRTLCLDVMLESKSSDWSQFRLLGNVDEIFRVWSFIRRLKGYMRPKPTRSLLPR